MDLVAVLAFSIFVAAQFAAVIAVQGGYCDDPRQAPCRGATPNPRVAGAVDDALSPTPQPIGEAAVHRRRASPVTPKAD
jgi:hypothetical protein